VSPEAQRIAIAEACGEINPRFTESGACIASTATADGIEWGTHGVADYLNDLDAMHEAEKTAFVECNQWADYFDALSIVCDEDNDPITATAAQRAEAFLRALNLWQESAPPTP
jgi:hypothetical protein